VDANWEGGVLSLHFGWNPNGISFSKTGEPTGEYKWLQLFSTLRRQKSSTGEWIRLTGSGLDDPFPYAAIAQTGTAVDSPGFFLTPETVEATAQDGLQMYLMFRPFAPGSIFAPLRYIGWNWTGQAVFTNGSWQLLTGSKSVEANDHDTTVRPEWTDYFTRLRWQDE